MMQALGQLSPLETIQAQIESYAGQFLQYKMKLLALQNSPSLQISSRATALLTTQTDLENQIQAALSAISTMRQTGQWDFGAIFGYGDLISKVVRQISDVNDLVAQNGGVLPAPRFSYGSFVMFALLTVGGLVTLGMLIRHKSTRSVSLLS